MPTLSQPTLTLTLPPEPESARRARRAITDHRRLDPDLDHTVSLLTTEMVANAIKHAGASEIHVAATLAPDFARVEVLDAGSGFDPDAVMGTGLGLRLIDKLASRWGVETARGCLVWFEVDRRRRRFTR